MPYKTAVNAFGIRQILPMTRVVTAINVQRIVIETAQIYSSFIFITLQR